MTIPENSSYARTLQQVNRRWEKDTLHLYELSASGELRSKEGTAWLMAKINHALGLTPKNESYLAMAPQLLISINTELRTMQSQAHSKTLSPPQALNQIDSAVQACRAVQTVINAESPLQPSQEVMQTLTNESRELLAKIQGPTPEQIEAITQLVNDHRIHWPQDDDEKALGQEALMSFYEKSRGDDGRVAKIIRKAIALEDALLALKARAEKNEQTPNDLFIKRIDDYIAMVAAYKPLIPPSDLPKL